jgi:hypothetical protein
VYTFLATYSSSYPLSPTTSLLPLVPTHPPSLPPSCSLIS